MKKVFTVDLESGQSYNVLTEYEIHHDENDSVGCSLSVIEAWPVKANDTAITSFTMSEIESALAYKIVDEYNDGDQTDTEDSENRGYLC